MGGNSFYFYQKKNKSFVKDSDEVQEIFKGIFWITGS